MAELVLHFDPAEGVDPGAAVEALRRRLTELAEVADASAEVDHARTSLPDVLVVLTMATTILTNGATALDALRKAIHAAKGLAEELGLRNARAEVGMAQVPVATLTDAQAREALQPSGG